MLRSVHIENFRALREFRMSGLGRVNLLVGTNNCGKTSILEALHLLSLAGHSAPLLSALRRRGEYVDGGGHLAVSHLVHGHRFIEGRQFKLEGTDEIATRSVTATMLTAEEAALHPAVRDALRPGVDLPDIPESILRVGWLRADESRRVDVPLLGNGGISAYRRLRDVEKSESDTAYIITTAGVSDNDVVGMLDATVLTPAEDLVLDALRVIEPGVQRLATVGPRDQEHDDYGRVMTMLAGQRLPLGSLGDGVKRLLGLALGLVRASAGVLLVDEIDTGLHYSVLTKMWQLVYQTANRLDVQVFATTHSRDCYESLAEIAVADRNDISVQRIERNKVEAVAFSEAELRVAAERGLEVR